MIRVAYQGEPGAYGEEAALRLFESRGQAIETLACPTFRRVFEAFEANRCEMALVPVENSYAGSVHEVYDLMLETPRAVVVGEAVLAVHHCLLAPSGVRLEDVRRARSHPQALSQCAPYLAAHAIEAVADADTAGAARAVAQGRPPATAAIAGRRAAVRYGLEILAHDIEAAHDNRTRFLLLGREAAPPTAGSKTSVVVWAAHVPGSLARCLTAIADHGLNLTKIESRPSREGPWQYVFYLDFEGHPDGPSGRRAMDALSRAAERVRLLGAYPAAPAPLGEESAPSPGG